MSEEFRKLQERNKRIIEIIKHKNDLVADLQKEISELTAERQANDLNLAALNYEGDSDNT